MALIKLQIITPVSQNNWSKSVKEVTTSEYNKWVRISNWYANIIMIYIYIHIHTHTPHIHIHTYRGSHDLVKEPVKYSSSLCLDRSTLVSMFKARYGYDQMNFIDTEHCS